MGNKRILSSSLKKKLLFGLEGLGSYFSVMEATCVQWIDKPAGLLVKAAEYMKVHDKMIYEMDGIVKEHGSRWTSEAIHQAEFEKSQLKQQLELNILFEERKQEFEDAKQSWEAPLIEFFQDRYGISQVDSLGVFYVFGAGSTALVLTAQQRWKTMSSGAAVDLYRPLISIADLGGSKK